MSTARSKDGTRIVFDMRGSGAPVLLVDGAFGHRDLGTSTVLATLLASHFKVLTYDRRGRGDSGNARAYAVDREVEDIAALIAQAGGAVSLYGASSGAALALEAARRGLNIRKLAVYEPPFVVDNTRPAVPGDMASQLDALVKADQRGAAVRMFLTVAGVPPLMISLMRLTPNWSKLKAVAHTLMYDARIMAGDQSGRPLSPRRWSSLSMATLVMDGEKSPPWMHNAVRGLQQVLPNCRYQQLPGEKHRVRPEAIAPVLREFFGRLTPQDLPFIGRSPGGAATAPPR
jgi:pimeloyl-ACP methyl ester carboxylesterase